MPNPTPPPTTSPTTSPARQLPCSIGWCIHRDGAHQAGPFAREADAFGALLRLQPMSTDWATTHEGWEFVAPDGACDSCVVIDRNPEACPGILAHCAAGTHCTGTDAACAASARYDHPSRCEWCGADLGLVRA